MDSLNSGPIITIIEGQQNSLSSYPKCDHHQQRLLTLGLTEDDIVNLDLNPHILQVICEYGGLSSEDCSISDTLLAASSVINNEIASIDQQIEMLLMQKEALKTKDRCLKSRLDELEGDGLMLAA